MNNQNKLAARRANLINRLWEFKRKVAGSENLDFSLLISDPGYRSAALDRHLNAHGTAVTTLVAKIAALDPGSDLGPAAGLDAFAQQSFAQRLQTLSQQPRYFIGAGIMLIAITVLIGMLTIKLVAFDNSAMLTFKPELRSDISKDLAHGTPVDR